MKSFWYIGFSATQGWTLLTFSIFSRQKLHNPILKLEKGFCRYSYWDSIHILSWVSDLRPQPVWVSYIISLPFQVSLLQVCACYFHSYDVQNILLASSFSYWQCQQAGILIYILTWLSTSSSIDQRFLYVFPVEKSFFS